jgi:bacteriocin-type transport-associated protein
MAEVLLKELSNTDIDWLISVGNQEEFAAGTVLVESGKTPEAVYLLLKGELTVDIAQTDFNLVNSSPPFSNATQSREVVHLSNGEVVGESCLFDIPPLAANIKVAETSLILSIARQTLATKLQDDIYFSSHFYRAIALILAERLRRMLEMPTQMRLINNPSAKEALFVFGELRDGDVDWLLAVGRLEKLSPGQAIIQAGRPVEALYIVLDGLLSAAVIEGDRDAVGLCFGCPIEKAESQQAIAELSRGQMSGTVSLLDSRPSPITVGAIEESLVLVIPRQQLMSKLQYDMGFASRFYRILATQLLGHLQKSLEILGSPQQEYSQEDVMDEEIEYDDELNVDSLHQMSQGAARFNWMLKRLGVV